MCCTAQKSVFLCSTVIKMHKMGLFFTIKGELSVSCSSPFLIICGCLIFGVEADEYVAFAEALGLRLELRELDVAHHVLICVAVIAFVDGGE